MREKKIREQNPMPSKLIPLSDYVLLPDPALFFRNAASHLLKFLLVYERFEYFFHDHFFFGWKFLHFQKQR